MARRLIMLKHQLKYCTRWATRRRRFAGSLAGVSEHEEPLPAEDGLGAYEDPYAPKLPSELEWERAELLEPHPVARHPELIGDGAAMPFPTAALMGPAQPLDPQDPATGALLEYLSARAAPKRASRPWQRGEPPLPASLDGWRVLVRSDAEVLFARGVPPQMLTVTFRRSAIRRSWSCAAARMAASLRAMRDGIRASSWRLDPTREPGPEERVLRVLVTEQAFASGQRADGRVLVPDAYMDADEVVLRMFVAPRPGYQTAMGNPETPVRIALAEPLGERRLLDGALV
jgi:hypothetical protein